MASCVPERAGAPAGPEPDVVIGADSRDPAPPDGATFPDLTAHMLRMGGDAFTVSLRAQDTPEGGNDAEVDVLRFAEEHRAAETTEEMDSLRDETGALDDGTAIYDLYRSGRWVVVSSGARPLTKREHAAVDGCLGIKQPVERPRPPISGATDTALIDQCLEELADGEAGRVVDHKRATEPAPTYLDLPGAIDVPKPDDSALTGLWTVQLGEDSGDLPQRAADLYVFSDETDAEEFAAQLDAEYDPFAEDQPLKLFEPFGRAVVLVYGSRDLPSQQVDSIKRCARA